MPVSLAVQTRELLGESVPMLKRRYEREFGESTTSNSRPYLVKRIAWRMQERMEGGLSERARLRARALADETELRRSGPRVSQMPGDAGPDAERVTTTLRLKPADRGPMPGTVIVREYKGERWVVRVLAKGFECRGTVHRSLSAAAQAITGSHWNGRLFFNLDKRPPKSALGEGDT